MLCRTHIAALAAFLPVLFLFSCASYNEQASAYYGSFARGDYQAASERLDHTRLLKKKRNRVLYLLEKGKVEHLLGNFEASNRYFNEADLLMEDRTLTSRDLIVSTLVNPMMENYLGEPFEKYMIHYYKALNYLQLGKMEDAVVEARRITLRTNAQADRVGAKRYAEDAFSFMMQGVIYEAAGDVNNAFIAYRNAAGEYTSNGEKYGTAIPEQLKKDVIRTAALNGFEQQVMYYEGAFGIHRDSAMSRNGELLIFWENGRAPVKVQEHLYFYLRKDHAGQMYFDNGKFGRIPYNYSSGSAAANFREIGFMTAVPRYQPQPLSYQVARVEAGGCVRIAEQAQDITQLAFSTLDERLLVELSKTLTRIAVKKLAEEAAKPSKDEDKKERRARQALATGLAVYRFGSEKPDTRNWQSLPHSISFIRIPLEPGENAITFSVAGPGNTSKQIQLRVVNTGRLQVRNICTVF